MSILYWCAGRKNRRKDGRAITFKGNSFSFSKGTSHAQLEHIPKPPTLTPLWVGRALRTE